MRFFVCFLFLIFSLSKNGFGQEVAIDAKVDEPVVNDFELSDKQFSSWRSIQNNWMANDYEAIQAEYNVKLNCKNCNSFYLEVILKVDANGKLEYYKLLDGKKCGQSITKQIELRMMRNFFKFNFPPELRSTRFKTRLGNSLKC